MLLSYANSLTLDFTDNPAIYYFIQNSNDSVNCFELLNNIPFEIPLIFTRNNNLTT